MEYVTHPSKNGMKIIKKSFRHKEYNTETDLTKYCSELKDKGAVPTVNFSIAKLVKGKSLINNCSLCLSEKLFIIRNLDNVNMWKKNQNSYQSVVILRNDFDKSER